MNQKYISQAAVNLLFCIDWRRIKRVSDIECCPVESPNQFFEYTMTQFDIAICVKNMYIAAESLGLRSIYIGNLFSYLPEVSEMLDLPKYVIPVMLMCVG